MAEKQAQLSGAYYGPAIPPPQQHYHRPGRGSGSGCGCCCLLSLLIKVIVTIAILIGLFILIVWLIFRPINKVNFYASHVALTEFNYTNDNMLHYNLALNITIRNPNKKIGIYYDSIEARAYYKDQRFGSDYLTPFYQGHKNTCVLSPVFKGQKVVTLQGQELTQLNQEKSNGIYSIDVKLYLRIRFKLGKIKTARFKPKVECDLKVPLNSANGRLAGGAENAECKIRY